MANFYQLTSLNSGEFFFINLEQIVKIESHGEEFVRLYLTSGDIEDVELREFNSALASSESGFFKFAGNDKPASGFDALDTDDVEDVTELSDGHMVRDEELAEPNLNNAQVEGSDYIDEGEEKIDSQSPETIAEVMMLLKRQGFFDNK